MSNLQPQPNWWIYRVPVAPDSAGRVREWASALAAAAGLPRHRRQDVALAMSELVALVLDAAPAVEEALRLTGSGSDGRLQLAVSWVGNSLPEGGPDCSPLASVVAQRYYLLSRLVDRWRLERRHRWNVVVVDVDAGAAMEWPEQGACALPIIRACQEAGEDPDVTGTLLLVEDHQPLREVLMESLILSGYQVAEAEHGAAALRLLQAGLRPDLIVLDLHMPVMNGRRFLEEKRRDPELAAIPVVLLSAYDRGTLAEQADVAAYLTKPCETEQLLETISQLRRSS